MFGIVPTGLIAGMPHDMPSYLPNVNGKMIMAFDAVQKERSDNH